MKEIWLILAVFCLWRWISGYGVINLLSAAFFAGAAFVRWWEESNGN